MKSRTAAGERVIFSLIGIAPVSKSSRTIFLLSLLLSCSFMDASGATKTFSGGAGFTFGDATKWTGGTLPMAGDDLIINGICIIDNSGLTDNIPYATLVIGGSSSGNLSWATSGTNRLNVTNVSSTFAGSSFDMSNGGTFIICGILSSTNLSFTPGAGTIDIRSTMTLPAAYPTYNNVTINASLGTVTAGVGTMVTNFCINSGTLNLNGVTLTVNGTGTYNAGTINNGTVSSVGATTTFAGTSFGAVVNATSNALYLNGSVFNNTVTFNKNGATDILSSGGNTFNNTATIAASGTGYFALGNTAADIFNADVVFTNTGSNALFMAFNAPGNQFNGTVTINCTGPGSSINGSFGPLATATYAGNIIVNNTSTNGVSFGAIGGLSTLADTKTISVGATGFNTGTLYLYFFTQNGTTAQALNLTGTATLTLGPSATFNGNVNFVSPQVYLNGATFNGTVYIEKKGATQNNSLGGNIFNSTTTLVNSGSGHLVLGYPTGVDIFNGDLTLTNSGTAGFYPAYNTAGHQFNGNVFLNLTAGTTVHFCGGTGTATLAAGKTISIGGSGFSSGTLSLSKFIQNSATAQTLSLTGTASLIVGPASTFNGNINFTAPQLYLNGGTYNGTASLTKSGATDNTSSGGNMFNAATSITNSGTGFFRLAGTTADDFNANVTFSQTGSGLLQPAYATNSSFAANISTAGTASVINFGTGGGTVTLDGSSAQSIAGPATLNLFNFVTDNTAGITLNTNLIVNGAHTFNAGIITTSATPNYLIYAAGSSYSGDGDSRHVSGWVKKIGNTDFIFPVGNATRERTIVLKNLSVSSEFNAKYLANTPNSYQYQYPVSDVNEVEYWSVVKVSGGSATVTLNWDNSKVHFPNWIVPDILVAGYDGSAWINMGGAGSGSGTASTTGSVSSGSVSTFGLFALASQSYVLPLTLVKFTAERKQGFSYLQWATENETDIDHFEIQKSNDSTNYSTVGTLRGRNNSRHEEYVFEDRQPLSSIVYYRLKTIAANGRFSYSKIIVLTDKPLPSPAFVVLNPVRQVVTILNKAGREGHFNYRLFNTAGQLILNGKMKIMANGSVDLAVPNGAPGSYFLDLSDGSIMFRQKILISQ
jgi:hypothetical protein